jgi:hypothetical protein
VRPKTNTNKRISLYLAYTLFLSIKFYKRIWSEVIKFYGKYWESKNIYDESYLKLSKWHVQIETKKILLKHHLKSTKIRKNPNRTQIQSTWIFPVKIGAGWAGASMDYFAMSIKTPSFLFFEII